MTVFQCDPDILDGRAYDLGYATINSPAWGPATIRLHLGWLTTQLRIDPADHFRWGRYDALCDLLARREPVLLDRREM